MPGPARWEAPFPKVLLIACSEGRLQQPLTEFMAHDERLARADRVMLPGGPGALVARPGREAAAALASEACRFLVEAHGIEEVVLVFHGAAPDGPGAAVCGAYNEWYPEASPEQLLRLQQSDCLEAAHLARTWSHGTSVRAFRAEVAPDGTVNHVPMASL
ncbi:MAG TPA: hypothetical protein VGN26_02830 [Armatimonadota bacterium]|jgi:hypothetical protein